MGLNSLLHTTISSTHSFDTLRNNASQLLSPPGPSCAAFGLCAVRHVEKLYYGNLEPHLLQGCDGSLYVTKFQNNPKHVRVLASEFLATKIGLWLGLPMAAAGAISVSDSFVAANPGLRIEIAHRTFVPVAAASISLPATWASPPPTAISSIGREAGSVASAMLAILFKCWPSTNGLATVTVGRQ
jgi:hypothetical protein